MNNRKVLIVTIGDDLHALAVQAALRNRKIECSIIESDLFSGRESIGLRFSSAGCGEALLRTAEGTLVDASSVDLIWWRRPKSKQQIDQTSLREDHLGLINNDCTASLVGGLESQFRGKWVSDPRATEYASNKINQLSLAPMAGFRIPETLISQSRDDLIQFYKKHSGKIIMKPVAGTPGPLLFTQFVSQVHLDSEQSIRTCPTIYQEFVPGKRHLRLNCFGVHCHACVIESDALDWRPNLNVPIHQWQVPEGLSKKVRHALDLLGLEMGIVDLKETEQGDIIWLEVNPQGQFLFLEGITGQPLTELFADFIEECLDGDIRIIPDSLLVAR